MRRRYFTIFLSSFLVEFAATLAIVSTALATDDAIPTSRRIEPFALDQVRLLPGPFKTAQDKDAAYLLSVEPDRLLAKFRKSAGLEPRAEHYGGWEAQSIAGHSLGHYLGAVSAAYASTGDARFKKISDYIVDELAECQEAGGDGLIAAPENFRDVFAEISRGEIRSQGFDLNGLWVPWYALHKIESGLLDAFRYCDNPKALDVARKLGDWGIDATQRLTEEEFQRMLDCEHGGINESYYDLYAATGDEKYLRAGDRFYHIAILKPLSEGRDELQGKHANTQFPKLIGLARRFELVGDADLPTRKTTEFFWERVVDRHTYAIGGNSDGEYFGEPGMLSERFSDHSAETCNTSNMLRLTQKLYTQSGDPKYLDFYERALCNHILASIDVSNDPDKLFTYYVPLTPGGFRHYSTRYNDWTCCHGTGMENPMRYNGAVYYREQTDDGDVLYLNLAIPSILDWSQKGVEATITSESTIKIETKKATRLVVKARIPNNCRIDAARVPDAEIDGRYFVVGRDWKAGETVVELPFVADWKLEATPDDPNCVAFFRGPFLYAGDLGDVARPLVASFEPSETDGARIPVVVSNSRDPNDLVDDAAPEKRRPLTAFSTAKLVAARPDAVELVPFYATKGRYEVYFDFFDEKQWADEAAKYEAERERARRFAAATVDVFQPGKMQSERDCEFVGEGSNFGDFNGRKWRDARDGGFFEFSLNVDEEKTCVLSLTYWGSDVGNRIFDVYVDGEKVATKRLDSEKPGRFFSENYPVANAKKKSRIRVRLQAQPGAIAGGIFEARTLRADRFDENSD